VAGEYPERDSFFSHRFVRLLMKSCAAMDIGQQSCLLLCYIVHTEDAARYSGPVRFWNEQLLTTLAMSPKQLRAARDKAIEFGWLNYDRDSDRTVGRYFVLIPEHLNNIPDGEIEPSVPSSGPVSSPLSGPKQHQIGDHKRTGNGTTKGPGMGPPSNPIPNPIPKTKTQADADASSVPQMAEAKSRRKPAFVKPTVSEIIAYVIEIKATVDAKEFFRHYESNGWMVGRNPMRNWQMAVQQWNARNKKGGLYDNARKSGHSAASREQANADAFAAFDAAVAAQSGRNAADDWRGSDTPLLT
jgi:hypothetical protein